jgi:hypothetical protein
MQYYLLFRLEGRILGLGVASLYGPPHSGLYKASSETYYTVQHTHKIQVIDIKCIDSVVMMAPDPRYPLFYHDGSEVDRWYLMQKPGRNIFALAGVEESVSEVEGSIAGVEESVADEQSDK